MKSTSKFKATMTVIKKEDNPKNKDNTNCEQKNHGKL